MATYGLYQTLDSPEFEGKIFPDENKNEVLKKIKKMKKGQEKAFIMLICEHARLLGELVYEEQNTKLPYGTIQNDKDVDIDFTLLPEDLKWRLWKFSKAMEG